MLCTQLVNICNVTCVFFIVPKYSKNFLKLPVTFTSVANVPENMPTFSTNILNIQRFFKNAVAFLQSVQNISEPAKSVYKCPKYSKNLVKFLVSITNLKNVSEHAKTLYKSVLNIQ